jgi:hypothetical protein
MIRRLFFGFGVVVAFSAPALAELAMTGAPVAMRAGPASNARIVQRIPASAETLPGNETPPPVVYAPPTYVTPPVWRWDGPYVGTNLGFGAGGW